MENIEKSIFTSNTEIMYSLRSEYSSLTPFEQRKVEDLATDVRNTIIEEYGKYMSSDVKTRFSSIENRVLVTDAEGFDQFYTDWLPNLPENKDKGDIPINARLFFIGNIVCMKDMKNEAEKAWEDNEEFYKKMEVSKESATSFFRYTYTTLAMVHEFTHAAWKEVFPTDINGIRATLGLAECSTSYITSEIIRKHFNYAECIINSPIEDNRIEVFKKILQKYGDNAYYIAFNHRPNDIPLDVFDKLRGDILAEFAIDTLINIGIVQSPSSGSLSESAS